MHNYEQDRAKLTEQLKMEEGKEPYRNARDKDFLAVYEGQPYMVDEFGGIPWMAEKDRKNSWGYGGMPENAEAFYKRLEGQIDAFIDDTMDVTEDDKLITLETGVSGEPDQRYLVQAVLVEGQ